MFLLKRLLLSPFKKNHRNAIIFLAIIVLFGIGVFRFNEPKLMEKSEFSDCAIDYVYDGDTVSLVCGDRSYKARLVGFDTPETKNAECPEELEVGKKATFRLRELVLNADLRFEHFGQDKYQRELIRLYINNSDAAEILVKEGLAAAYDGGVRPDWCKILAP